MDDMRDLRKSYQSGTLDEKSLTKDPLDLFRQWWNETIESGVEEANAMTLATVDASGHPSARIVLLKGLSDDGFEFYTNYQSRKAIEMESHPHVSLLFFWKELERQVRIEGKVTKASFEQSQSYFQSRPRGSQVGAWASPQSEVIPDRDAIEKLVKEIELKFEGQETLPLPPHWGGYVVDPVLIEFWQGRPDRLHDRFQYTRKEHGKWNVVRLAP